jgi:hypothetical protein
MSGMNKKILDLFAMLKTAEADIKKEHQVLMVKKTTNFKKDKGKKGGFKKSSKSVDAPAKKPKVVPKLETMCFCCTVDSHMCRGFVAKKTKKNLTSISPIAHDLSRCNVVTEMISVTYPRRSKEVNVPLESD